MLLAIDAGNTNTVFSIFDGDKPPLVWRCHTLTHRTSDEYAAFLTPLFNFEGLSFDQIDATIMSSVVPDVNFNLIRFSEHYCECPMPIVGSPNMKTGIQVDVDRPYEVGSDRLVNSVAAALDYQTPCVIIDFGTATTFDVVTEGPVYKGGIIAPGINLSLEALYRAAAKLPKISLSMPGSVIGKNTTAAMNSGVYWGYVSLIEGLVEKIKDELVDKPTIIATGGLAAFFAENMPVIDHVDNELTLRGLKRIHDLNQ